MKRRPNSVKGSRRWGRIGLKGRATRLRQGDTGLRKRPARRTRRRPRLADLTADDSSPADIP